MAYTSYTLAQLGKHDVAITMADGLLKQAVKTNDKSRVKTAEKNLEAKVKDLKAYFDSEMKGVEANFKQHAKQVETFLKVAKQVLAEGKAGLAKLEKNPQDKEAALAATTAAEKTKAQAELASADAQAFGESWFKIRGYNGSSQFGAKNVADLNKRIGSLMNNGKFVTQQVSAVGAIADEAKSISTAADRITQGATATDPKAARDRALKLLNEMIAINDAIHNHDKHAIRSIEGKAKTLQGFVTGGLKNITPDVVRNLKSFYLDIMSIQQILFQHEKSLKSKYEIMSKAFTKQELKDDQVASALKTAKNIVVTAEKDIKACEGVTKTAVANYSKIEKAVAAK